MTRVGSRSQVTTSLCEGPSIWYGGHRDAGAGAGGGSDVSGGDAGVEEVLQALQKRPDLLYLETENEACKCWRLSPAGMGLIAYCPVGILTTGERKGYFGLQVESGSMYDGFSWGNFEQLPCEPPAKLYLRLHLISWESLQGGGRGPSNIVGSTLQFQSQHEIFLADQRHGYS